MARKPLALAKITKPRLLTGAFSVQHAGYQALGFAPQLMQTMRGFKFVYLFPR